MKSGLFQPLTLARRRDRLRESLVRARLDAILIMDRLNALYLAGFDGSNCQVLVTRNHGDFFLTDFRYIEMAEKTIRGMEVRLIKQFRDPVLPDLLNSLKIKRLGFEESLSWGSHRGLTAFLSKQTLKPAGDLVTALRLIKDRAEIDAIGRGQTLNQQLQEFAFREACRGGLTELQLQRKMRDWLADQDSAEAFETIVASGTRSSLPHARPGPQKIGDAGWLLLDSGAKLGHYHSDMTRTAYIGKPEPKHREIYQVVLDAQQAALDAIGPGVPCRKVDAAARNLITKAGYGDLFGHGTGHGVGLEIHEAPRLNQTSKETLKPGMVVTVEPGIYVPGFGGVRIEDLVVVTEKGYRNLTSASKEFQALRIGGKSTSQPKKSKGTKR